MSDIDRYKELARHATAWPKNYRNYFVAGGGSDDLLDWFAMVSEGWAVDGGGHPFLYLDDRVFHVTDKGYDELLRCDDA